MLEMPAKHGRYKMNNHAFKVPIAQPIQHNPPKKIVRKIHSLQKKGQFKESLELCNKAAAQGINDANFMHMHGLALRANGDLTAALVTIHQAHEQQPDDILIINSLGVVFLQMNEVETAIELFKRATKMDEKSYTSWRNLGIALKTTERYQAADLAFTCAHHLEPGQTEPLLHLVDILIENRAYGRARNFLDKILAKAGEVTPTLQLKRLQIVARMEDFDAVAKYYEEIDRSKLNKDQKATVDNIWAYYLKIMGRNDEALEVLEALMGQNTAVHDHIQSQLGMLHYEMGNIEKAIELHEAVLEKDPSLIGARYNLANLQFINGDIEQGYKNYETRWEWREFTTRRRKFSIPRWQGESLEGKKILVWREQGIGDEVRFASLIPELKERGGAVTFECSIKLIPLWERAFPGVNIEPQGPLECRGVEAYEEYDYQIPVGSLGTYFRTRIEDFTEKQKPWLPRFEEAEDRIRQHISVAKNELLVGLCWSSSNKLISRDKYFLDANQLGPLKDLENVKWLNVQYDADQEVVDDVRMLGIDLNHCTNIDQKEDLIGACGMLGACDLVISIGGSVADITGGLGVPTVYITKENSEVFLGTDYVPWFPAALSLPIKPDGGDEIIAKIIDQWPSIIKWAKEIKSADRQGLPELSIELIGSNTDAGTGNALDFEYSFEQ